MAIDTMFTSAASRDRPGFRTVLPRVWRACRAWYIKRHTRYSLLDLTEEQLQDIGISRAEARREAGKSFYWDMNA